jgi:hypothetical protein
VFVWEITFGAGKPAAWSQAVSDQSVSPGIHNLMPYKIGQGTAYLVDDSIKDHCQFVGNYA